MAARSTMMMKMRMSLFVATRRDICPSTFLAFDTFESMSVSCVKTYKEKKNEKQKEKKNAIISKDASMLLLRVRMFAM